MTPNAASGPQVLILFLSFVLLASYGTWLVSGLAFAAGRIGEITASTEARYDCLDAIRAGTRLDEKCQDPLRGGSEPENSQGLAGSYSTGIGR